MARRRCTSGAMCGRLCSRVEPRPALWWARFRPPLGWRVGRSLAFGQGYATGLPLGHFRPQIDSPPTFLFAGKIWLFAEIFDFSDFGFWRCPTKQKRKAAQGGLSHYLTGIFSLHMCSH